MELPPASGRAGVGTSDVRLIMATASDKQLFASPDVERRERDDGSVLLRSRVPLDDYAPSVGVWLRRWAVDTPHRVFLAERPGGDPSHPWTTVTYGESHEMGRRIGQALLDLRLGPDRPLAVLSGSSITHGLLMLGCHLAGVPIVPVSVAYSLIADDLTKVEHIIAQTDPGAVFAESSAQFEHVLAPLDGREILTGDGELGTSFAELTSTRPSDELDAITERIGPDDVAKILYTSGSTGMPKGVLTTHRMLCSNQAAMTLVWPFLSTTPPIICDWLPWSHTFGSSHNFNMVLAHGGTLYIDTGKPAPGLFDTTVANLVDVRPTISFNVPAGYVRLVERLESDAAAATAVFDRLQLIFYAAAALPHDVWHRMAAVSRATTGQVVPMTSSWGLTETAPAATTAHFPLDGAGNIGTPLPGVTLKLVPSDDKTEVRVAGPCVTPGYHRDPERTADAFDDEGYFITGDAVVHADADDPNSGLVFDGRVAEDFKLTTGTWVSVGTLRPSILAATSPLLLDCVIAGHGRERLGLLAWLAPDRTDTPELRQQLRERLRQHNADHGGSSSTCIRTVLILDQPPSLDVGETTDKGYINQRAVLQARHENVEQLFGEPVGPDVLIID